MDYSFVRESFNKDYSNNYVLSIQLEPDGFSFFISTKDSLNSPLYFLFRRFERSGIESLWRELNNFNEYDKINFYKTIIIYHTDKFCLIPEEFYNPDDQDKYLKLTQSMTEELSNYSSDIQEIKAKIVFSLSEELNSLVNLKFPSAILLHSACPAIHFGIQKSGKSCVIYYYGSSISIAVFDKNELKLFNIYQVKDENDLIYFILNALKNCNQKVSETNFYFSGMGEDGSRESIAVKKYIPDPVFYNPSFQDMDTSDIPVSMLFNHLEALHCV